MKKKVVIVAIAMLAVFALVACGAPAADPAIVGTWTVETMEANGMTFDLAKLAGTPGLDENTKAMMTSMKITATADGKMKMEASSTTSEGTWKADGSNFIITSDGQDMNTSIKDGKMTMEFQGIKMIMKKS